MNKNKELIIAIIVIVLLILGGLFSWFQQRNLEYQAYKDCQDRNVRIKGKLLNNEPGSGYEATYSNQYENCEKIKPGWLK